MNWLILSVLASSGLFLIFTHMGKLKVHVLPVIVVNYWTCFIVGNLLPGQSHVFHIEYLHRNWFWPVLCMGILFIAGFYSMGAGTAAAGAAPASVAAKMSVVVPAAVAIIWLSEKPEMLQITGMLVSLIAVFLMTEPQSDGKRLHKGLWLLVLIFITSGAVDTGLNLITHFYSENTNPYTVSTIIFGSAAVLSSTSILLIRRRSELHKSKLYLGKRELILGVVLGVINYVSLIAILSGIESYAGSTAWFFTVNNIGIVAVSSVLAALIFKEKIHKSGYWGLALALLALVFMNWNVIF